MTNEELSKQVAELYGIDAYKDQEYSPTELWLHNDSARVFELMCEHELNVEVWSDIVEVTTFLDSVMEADTTTEVFDWHNNDKALATRIAILKCLLKIKEVSHE